MGSYDLSELNSLFVFDLFLVFVARVMRSDVGILEVCLPLHGLIRILLSLAISLCVRQEN